MVASPSLLLALFAEMECTLPSNARRMPVPSPKPLAGASAGPSRTPLAWSSACGCSKTLTRSPPRPQSRRRPAPIPHRCRPIVCPGGHRSPRDRPHRRPAPLTTPGARSTDSFHILLTRHPGPELINRIKSYPIVCRHLVVEAQLGAHRLAYGPGEHMRLRSPASDRTTRAWQSIISGLLKFRVRGGAPVTWVVENHGVVIQDFEPLGKFDTIWNILLQAQHGATGQPDQLGCELGCLVGGGELGDD